MFKHLSCCVWVYLIIDIKSITYCPYYRLRHIDSFYSCASNHIPDRGDGWGEHKINKSEDKDSSHNFFKYLKTNLSDKSFADFPLEICPYLNRRNNKFLKTYKTLLKSPFSPTISHPNPLRPTGGLAWIVPLLDPHLISFHIRKDIK